MFFALLAVLQIVLIVLWQTPVLASVAAVLIFLPAILWAGFAITSIVILTVVAFFATRRW